MAAIFIAGCPAAANAEPAICSVNPRMTAKARKYVVARFSMARNIGPRATQIKRLATKCKSLWTCIFGTACRSPASLLSCAHLFGDHAFIKNDRMFDRGGGVCPCALPHFRTPALCQRRACWRRVRPCCYAARPPSFRRRRGRAHPCRRRTAGPVPCR